MDILVVEDSEENRCLMEHILQDNGYEVVLSSDGLEALKMLKSRHFDIIISDILMPRMDGFQLCRTCKQDKSLKNIPFIFYTATYVDKKDEAFALSLGAERFIVKPIQIEAFLKTLNEVISQHLEGTLVAPHKTEEDEAIYLTQYNRRLIQKLEKKMLDLRSVNRILKNSEESYRELVESINDGVMVINSSGNLVFTNPKFCELSGYTKDEVIAHHITSLIHADDIFPFTIVLKETLAGNKVRSKHEARLVTRSQSNIWVEYSANTVKREGQIISALIIMRDLTKQKKLAEENLKAKERTIEEIKQHDQYVLRVADELRNPLQILKGTLELFPTEDLNQDQSKLFDMFRKNLTLLENGIKKLT